MTPKMVANFRRSLSFQNHPSSSTSTSKLHRKNIFHVRSTSLPCRSSYPLISQLKDPIRDLRNDWSSSSSSKPITSANLIDGLTRLKTIHESLDDLLQLNHTRESLRQNPDWVEKVLDDFLGLIDIYGIFQSLVLALKQEVSAARLAIRRTDDSKARLYIKALKKTAKETIKLVSATRSIRQAPVPGSDVLEVCELIRDVMEVTVLVSGSLFGGISSSFSTRKTSWLGLKYAKRARVEEGIQEFQLGMGRLWGLRREKDEEVKRVLKKMAEMEECISGIECGSEKMFRSLISTRVSLLNVLTR